MALIHSGQMYRVELYIIKGEAEFSIYRWLSASPWPRWQLFNSFCVPVKK